MLQTGWRQNFLSNVFSHNPLFLKTCRHPTIFLSRLFCNPIGQGKKHDIRRIFGHIPPKPLPLSLLNKNDPIDKQIIRLVKHGILRIKTIKIGGEK